MDGRYDDGIQDDWKGEDPRSCAQRNVTNGVCAEKSSAAEPHVFAQTARTCYKPAIISDRPFRRLREHVPFSQD
jgi:hypothetical protein